MVRALALGFENDLQEAAKVALGPALLLEPAEVFRREVVKLTSLEPAEWHRPLAQFFPILRRVGIHAGFCPGPMAPPSLALASAEESSYFPKNA